MKLSNHQQYKGNEPQGHNFVTTLTLKKEFELQQQCKMPLLHSSSRKQGPKWANLRKL